MKVLAFAKKAGKVIGFTLLSVAASVAGIRASQYCAERAVEEAKR